jgi:DNA-binding beta-propeller fold protein YncE
MRRTFAILAVVFTCWLATPIKSEAQDRESLRFVQAIPLPNVKGRLDHMDVDVADKRLFVAGLENGSVEVVDLKSGQWIKSLPGFRKPQGIAYVKALNKLFVASGDDGKLRAFHGDTFELLDSINLGTGPNRVTWDPRKKLLYVGYDAPDAGKDHGEVGIIDGKTDNHLGDIKVDAHPAEILLNKSGKTLYVFLPTIGKVQVVDTKKRQVVSTWTVSNKRPGDAALDDVRHRLLIGTRTPPEMVAMNSESGKEVAHRPTVEGMDGVYFDAARKRVYVSGGRGFDVGNVFIYQELDGDHYAMLGKISTRPGAGTSFWSPELNRYYVAAPAHDQESAAILVFEAQP